MTVNPNIHPPGGFWFSDADEVRHEAGTLQALVTTLTEYRARVGRDPGEPLKEITEQLCARTPWLCVKPEPGMVLVAKITAWATRLFRDTRRADSHKVEASEALKRSQACLGCPHRIDWSKVCPPCFSKTKKILKTSGFGISGFACDLAGDDLEAATELAQPFLLADAPEHCWRKKYDS